MRHVRNVFPHANTMYNTERRSALWQKAVDSFLALPVAVGDKTMLGWSSVETINSAFKSADEQ